MFFTLSLSTQIWTYDHFCHDPWKVTFICFLVQIYTVYKFDKLDNSVRIMTWIRREGLLMSDLVVSFYGSILSLSWIQVSFILIDGVCLELEFYDL